MTNFNPVKYVKNNYLICQFYYTIDNNSCLCESGVSYRIKNIRYEINDIFIKSDDDDPILFLSYF